MYTPACIAYFLVSCMPYCYDLHGIAVVWFIFRFCIVMNWHERLFFCLGRNKQMYIYSAKRIL